jgi:hypothetical protein
VTLYALSVRKFCKTWYCSVVEVLWISELLSLYVFFDRQNLCKIHSFVGLTFLRLVKTCELINDKYHNGPTYLGLLLGTYVNALSVDINFVAIA